MTELLHRDIRRSSIYGAAQILVGVVTYAVLYPLILEKSGLEVVGLWSLAMAMSAYMTLSDVGFSITLTRKISSAGTRDEAASFYGDYLTSVRFYVGVFIGLSLMWLLAQSVCSDMLPLFYGRLALVWTILLLILATGVQLVAQLNGAVLAGIHETFYIKKVGCFLPVCRLVIGGLGAYWARPLEGIVLAILFENLLSCLLFHWRIKKVFPQWGRAGSYPQGRYWRRLWRLMRDGRDIYLISLGNMFREPVFRAMIVYILGFAAAGLYDIAKRVPDMIRSLLVGGSQSYMPAFGRLLAQGDLAAVEGWVRRMVAFLCAGGALFLGGFYACGGDLFAVWLPSLPPSAFAGARIMTIWAGITLINVPYWYLIQAANRERAAALSMWSHSGLILLLIPLNAWASFELSDLLIYWCATSLVAQILLYAAVQRSLGLFWRTISPAVYYVFVGLVMIVAIWAWRSVGFVGGGESRLVSLATNAVVGLLCWTGLVLMLRKVAGTRPVI